MSATISHTMHTRHNHYVSTLLTLPVHSWESTPYPATGLLIAMMFVGITFALETLLPWTDVVVRHPRTLSVYLTLSHPLSLSLSHSLSLSLSLSPSISLSLTLYLSISRSLQ